MLKSKTNVALREQYRVRNGQQRRMVLVEVDRQPLPGIGDVDTSPALSEFELNFSNRQLCAMMRDVQDLPLMGVNPGVASASQWNHIAPTREAPTSASSA
ncbi:MAG: hypothetical protein ACREM8_10690 [Vulcanimicrobiaceae bacterium]